MVKSVYSSDNYSSQYLYKLDIDSVIVKIEKNQPVSTKEFEMLISSLRSEESQKTRSLYFSLLITLLSEKYSTQDYWNKDFDKTILKVLGDSKITRSSKFTENAIEIVKSKLNLGMNDLVNQALNNISAPKINNDNLINKKLLNNPIILDNFVESKKSNDNKISLSSEAVKNICFKTGRLNSFSAREVKNYIINGGNLSLVSGAFENIEKCLSDKNSPNIFNISLVSIIGLNDLDLSKLIEQIISYFPYVKESRNDSLLKQIVQRFEKDSLGLDLVINKFLEHSLDEKQSFKLRYQSLDFLCSLANKGCVIDKDENLLAQSLQDGSEQIKFISSKLIKLNKSLLNNNIKSSVIKLEIIEDKSVKSALQLTTEIAELNAKSNIDVSDFIKSDQTKQILKDISDFADKDSVLSSQEGVEIKKWLANDIKSWSKDILKKELSQKDLPEILAVINQAVYLHNGYLARDVQIMTVLTLLNAKEGVGRLAQVSTGEGKSTVTAMLAAAKHFLTSKPVDIITSSSVLAERDADEQKSFFSLFGLSCANNILGNSNGAKECYKADILYGTVSNFQGDLLRDEYKGLGTRCNRAFGVVLVDEVDSMLVDDGAKITKLSSPMPAMEHIAPIFALGWSYLKRLDIDISVYENKEKREELEKELSQYLTNFINNGMLSFPVHLSGYIENQIKPWVKSLIYADIMHENKHYVISQNDQGHSSIAPVDYAGSGIVQSKINWANGLHQFLQVKHGLKITSENLSTSFISNMNYFKRYGADIYGMTGTMGSLRSQQLLQEEYKIDIALIPTFKTKKFTEEQGIVTAGKDEHLAALIKNATLEAADNGRAVLLLCETIADCQDLSVALQNSNYSKDKIKLYTRNDKSNESESIAKATSGDIIIATNLAGRGTDIKLTDEVQKNGGMHVILSFLPSNLRVEEQAYGRTARSGNPGTGKLIIDGIATTKNLGLEYEKEVSIEKYKQSRDFIEEKRLDEVQEKELKRINFNDEKFISFNKEIYQPLKLQINDQFMLEQLEELWGLWLHKALGDDNTKFDTDAKEKIEKSFDIFKKDMLKRYGDNNSLIENQAYLTQIGHRALSSDLDQSIKSFNRAIELDDSFSYGAHYNLAYAYLRKNFTGKEKEDTELTNLANNHLKTAKYQIESVAVPQLQIMQMALGNSINGSELGQQIATKIDLLQKQVSYMDNALSFIGEKADGKKIMKIKSFTLMQDLFVPDKVPIEEIREMNQFGVIQLYEIEAKNPPKDRLTGAFVTVLGIAQAVVGVMGAIASGGTAKYAIDLIAGGIKDIYQGIKSALKGEGVDLGQYFKDKAIEFAVALVSNKFFSTKGSEKLVKKTVEKGAEEGAKQTVVTLTTSQVLKKVGIQVGRQLLQEQAVKVLSKELTKGFFKESYWR
jgi:preprotein translocase subunit SecA